MGVGMGVGVGLIGGRARQGGCHRAAGRQVARASGAVRRAEVRMMAGRKVQNVLVPIGDGDSSHIGEDVPMPKAILLKGKQVLVGRDEGVSDVALGVPTVSGQHAKLVMGADGSWFVTDLGSTNGTYVNGVALEAGKGVQLGVGDVVIFGDEFLASFLMTEEEQG